MINNEIVEQFERVLVSLFKSKTFKNTSDLVVTDIHIQPMLTESAVYVYDDDDVLLYTEKCFWLCDLDRSSFYDEFLKLARNCIHNLKEKSFFNGVNILQPFSFVLIDENKETVNEIDIIDDDMIVLNDELLKGWEEEMDSFIDELLKN